MITDFNFSVSIILSSANAIYLDMSEILSFCKDLFVWGFTWYQQYFSYLKVTIHKSMFP